jgi:putative FmdB family regulatory protein
VLKLVTGSNARGVHVPTYQYRCTQCGRELEVVQKFTDSALTECESCQGALRKVYNAVGVVFKGSGFYRTDSRKADGNGASRDSADKKSGDSGAGQTSGTKTGDNAASAGSSSSDSSSGSSGGGGSNGSGSTSGKTAASASSTAA